MKAIEFMCDAISAALEAIGKFFGHPFCRHKLLLRITYVGSTCCGYRYYRWKCDQCGRTGSTFMVVDIKRTFESCGKRADYLFMDENIRMEETNGAEQNGKRQAKFPDNFQPDPEPNIFEESFK